ncbi:hypothetical protein M5E82_10850 [Parabacteroides distasonis]|nr:hypothetical protein M5E82_10850 [Parabacteroides distasonis]
MPHTYIDVGLCERRREAMSVYVLDGVDAGENKKHRCIKFTSLKGNVIRSIAFLLALWEYNLINIVKRMSVVKKNAYIGVDLGGRICVPAVSQGID